MRHLPDHWDLWARQHADGRPHRVLAAVVRMASLARRVCERVGERAEMRRDIREMRQDILRLYAHLGALGDGCVFREPAPAGVRAQRIQASGLRLLKGGLS